MADDDLRDLVKLVPGQEDWTEEERRAVIERIEESYQQALRGELIDADQARADIARMKEEWCRSRGR